MTVADLIGEAIHNVDGLDAGAQVERVQQTLAEDKYGFACLFVSHDLGAVEQVADRVLVMDDDVVVEGGPRDEGFDSAQHPVTRRLLSAMPALQPEGSGFRLQRRASPAAPSHSTRG
jgi:peptide/nickel transport system ATP-binding protein